MMRTAEFDILDFITVIKTCPAIWDNSCEEYTNRTSKKYAWDSVIKRFVPNYDEMSPLERSSVLSTYQRKWKSLRNSYSRERAKQRKDTKLGPAAKYRKMYIFYDQLSFLEKATKTMDDSTHATDDDDSECDITMQSDEEQCSSTDFVRKPNDRKFRKGPHAEEELYNVVEAKHVRVEPEKKADDDDKLFLLSLHSDLKTLPDHIKIGVKCLMMNLISSAKQTTYSSTAQMDHSTFMHQHQSLCLQSFQLPQISHHTHSQITSSHVVKSEDPSHDHTIQTV